MDRPPKEIGSNNEMCDCNANMWWRMWALLIIIYWLLLIIIIIIKCGSAIWNFPLFDFGQSK